MSIPRQVLPGSTYMITRRCTQRQFLMRPDREPGERVRQHEARGRRRRDQSRRDPAARAGGVSDRADR